MTFESRAEIAYPMSSMTETGKLKAVDALNSLEANGGTNLWAGVEKGLDVLRVDTSAVEGRKKYLLLLTDGQPTVDPPKGHLGALQSYLEKQPNFQFQLNTFGFGYNLDSEILLSLAVEGRGTFAFIPDSPILGTCFVNSVSNAICCFSQRPTLHLMLKGGAEFAGDVLGRESVLDTSWGRVVHLSPLQAGQSCEVVVPLRIPALSMKESPTEAAEPYLEAVLVWPLEGEKGGEKRETCLGYLRTSNDLRALAAYMRCETVKVIYKAVSDAVHDRGNAANADILALSGKLAIAAHTAEADTTGSVSAGRIISLAADVKGRVQKSLSTKERFKRWGKHYMRSFARSHQIQQCTNYMDASLKEYKSLLFSSLVDEGGRVFLSLPPPGGSHRGNQHSAAATTTASGAAYPPPVMQTYYAGSSGGCFGGDSLVTLQLQEMELFHHDQYSEQQSPPRRVKEVKFSTLRKGDRVLVFGGGVAIVRCLVEIRCSGDNNRKKLASVNPSLQLTLRHPIRDVKSGKWTCVQDMMDDADSELSNDVDGNRFTPADLLDADVVYNVLLDRDDECGGVIASPHPATVMASNWSRVLLVGGRACLTLGHGLSETGACHEFYGNEAKVVENLQQRVGWHEGYVCVTDSLKTESATTE